MKLCRSFNSSPRQVPKTVDFLVVGGGPAGIAAARALLERNTTASVVLAEAGEAPSVLAPPHLILFSGRDILPFPSSGDWGYQCCKPLGAEGNPESSLAPSSLAAYPRGRGVGGTDRLGWGLLFPSAYNAAELNGCQRAVRKAREGAVLLARAAPHPYPHELCESLPAEWGSTPVVMLDECSGPLPRTGSFQLPALIDSEGERLPLLSSLFSGLADCHRLHILCGFQVARLATEQQRVTSVCLQRGGGGTHTSKEALTIHVSKGVVLAAGLVGSPRLLRQLQPHVMTAESFCRDGLVLPMLFKTKPGLTLDHAMTNSAMMVALKSAISGIQPNWRTLVADVFSPIPLSQCGKARLLAVPLPFGGRNGSLFYQLGIDRILGQYEEAAVFLLLLTGIDGLQFSLEHQETRRMLSAGPALDAQPEVKATVLKAFAQGMAAVRKAATSASLSSLLAAGGTLEATDCLLLHSDPLQARRLAILSHTPPSKLSKKNARELYQLLVWARELSQTEAYMESYILHHTRWLGFGSGSSEAFLTAGKQLFVKGFDNLVVGDVSAVRYQQWLTSDCDALVAGSTASAMDAGSLAATQLLKRMTNDK